MSRRTLPLVGLLGLTLPAHAMDSHTISIAIETPTAVRVDALATELTFPATVPGISMDGQTATGAASVAYTSSGDSALMVEIDVDPNTAGIDILARAASSDCGTPMEVLLMPVPQAIIELDAAGSCAEMLQVEYEGTIIQARDMDGSFMGVVTYTLL